MFHLCVTRHINKSDGTGVKAPYATFNTRNCASAGAREGFSTGSHKLRHSAVSGKPCFHCLTSPPSQTTCSIKPPPRNQPSACGSGGENSGRCSLFHVPVPLLSSTGSIWASDVPTRPPDFLLRNLTVFHSEGKATLKSPGCILNDGNWTEPTTPQL